MKSLIQSLKGKSFNGYHYAYFESGLIFFQKQVAGKGWALICCEEKQVSNGDLEYMTAHDLTLDKGRQKAVKRKYMSTFNPVFQ